MTTEVVYQPNKANGEEHGRQIARAFCKIAGGASPMLVMAELSTIVQQMSEGDWLDLMLWSGFSDDEG